MEKKLGITFIRFYWHLCSIYLYVGMYGSIIMVYDGGRWCDSMWQQHIRDTYSSSIWIRVSITWIYSSTVNARSYGSASPAVSVWLTMKPRSNAEFLHIIHCITRWYKEWINYAEIGGLFLVTIFSSTEGPTIQNKHFP